MRELDSWERTRWTLAHELGHLMLHVGQRNVGQEQENEASRFASEFLAPFAVTSEEIRGIPSLVNLMPLKDKWGISLGALIRHFRDSGGMDKSRYEMLTKQLYTRINVDTGVTWGRTEPGWDSRAPERPRLMSKWVEFVYGAGSVKEMAVHKTMWPNDLLAEFLMGQRGRSGTPPKRSPTGTRRRRVGDDGDVVEVDFANRGRERRA